MNHTFVRRGQSLVGVLVGGAVLLAFGAWFLVPHSSSADKPQRTVLKRAVDRGQSVDTASNISQIQQVIEMYKNDNDGRPPASYDELRRYAKDFPAEMWVDGVSGQPLVYDANTGRIMAPAGSNANVPAAGACPEPCQMRDSGHSEFGQSPTHRTAMNHRGTDFFE